jgi:hypothetical protein
MRALVRRGKLMARAEGEGEGETLSAVSGASLRSRFCLFFSSFVNLSAGDTEGADAPPGDGEDVVVGVDVAVGVDVGEVIGTIRRG